MTERTLLLLRHAKSSWDDPDLDDFDRPLAARGRIAAPLVGAEMALRGWVPERALVSSALRTRQTWKFIANALPVSLPVTFEKAIYEAPAGQILEEIRQTPANVPSLLVVGHNPGLENLAAMLASPESDARAMARLKGKFPTGALARLTFAGAWRDLAAGSARLRAFLVPRDLS